MLTGSIHETETNKSKGRAQRFLSLLVLSLFALTIFAGNVRAQIVGDLVADIPFQFHVGNKELSAGSYHIRMSDQETLRVMEITSTDGSTSVFFQVQESDAKSAPAKSELVFNKYGNNYFLAKLFELGSSSGSELIESRTEKHISKDAVVAQEYVPARRPMERGN